MDQIFAFLAAHRLTPCVGRCFPFSQIWDACIALDSGTVNGKIVVTLAEEAEPGPNP